MSSKLLNTVDSGVEIDTLIGTPKFYSGSNSSVTTVINRRS